MSNIDTSHMRRYGTEQKKVKKEKRRRGEKRSKWFVISLAMPDEKDNCIECA